MKSINKGLMGLHVLPEPAFFLEDLDFLPQTRSISVRPTGEFNVAMATAETKTKVEKLNTMTDQ